jgi:hypothetical protein
MIAQGGVVGELLRVGVRVSHGPGALPVFGHDRLLFARGYVDARGALVFEGVDDERGFGVTGGHG